MGVFMNLSTLALRQLIDGACSTVGLSGTGEAVVGLLTRHFIDHSKKLTEALENANERAWKALEIALAGNSFWDRCQVVVASGEDKAFGRQVRAFLDANPLSTGGAEFRDLCLQELRIARKKKLLTGGSLDPQALAQQAGAFARFADPRAVLAAEWQAIDHMAQELRQAGHPNLGQLLSSRPPQGMPLLVVAVRYFFRRQVETDQELFQGLAFAHLERLGQSQDAGFAALDAALTQHGERLETLLGEIQSVVVETHSAVLDLQGQIEGQSDQVRRIGQGVQKLLEQYHLHRREVRPGDSLSIRNDTERQLVKQLVARYRALPEGDRKGVPALLNAVGKLEVVAGDFDAAQKDFQAVALLEQDDKGQAEAHHNAYLASLEKRDWPGAIQELVKAIKLDGKRFAPFPVGKYQPVRILGAGGFGVAFLCKHKYMDAQVVVKTLGREDLGRDADKVFTEAQVLRQLDHPAIIRISECGYVDGAKKSRPFLIMDYFQGATLEEYVKKHGPLSVNDLLAVARPVAEGLQAAHAKGILHRDVKPANLLVRKEGARWHVKVIDFGLALRHKVAQTTMNASTAKRGKTLAGDSIAGTIDYAAPEQMGRRKDPIGPYSDVYGWAKTCCYALFQTTQPLMKHWHSIPEALAQLLEKCLDEDPTKRPQGFADVLAALDKVTANPAGPASPPRPTAEQAFAFEEAVEETPKRHVAAAKPRRPASRLPLLIGGGVALAAVIGVVLLTVVLRVKTPAGTLVVEVDQPGAEVYVDGQRYTITRPGDNEPIQVEVQEGTRQLKVVKGGFETFTKEFTVKSGDKETIRVRLEPAAIASNDVKPKTPPPPETPKEPGPNTTTTEVKAGDVTVQQSGEEKEESFEYTVEGQKKKGTRREITLDLGGGVAMEFVRIPHGTFTMGSPDSDEEKPLHLVEITKDFYLGKFLVTQQQYQALMGGNPSWFSASGGGKDKVRSLDTARFPVEQVGWDDAQTFCQKLSDKAHRKAVLPTEAQWEYACRAGTATRFPCGDNVTAADANFDENLGRTCPVGSYAANPFGLYDMMGNVFEWCSDYHYGNYINLRVYKDPENLDKSNLRVLRAGSWNFDVMHCRAAYRCGHAPADRKFDLGFRVVLRLENPSTNSDIVPADIPPSPPAVRELTNSIGMKLVLIPAGKFTMGSPKGQEGRQDNEGPQHEAEITLPFYMATCPVSRGQFAAFVDAERYQTEAEEDKKGGTARHGLAGDWEQKPEYTWRNLRFSNSQDHPVVEVTWNDAHAFCAWLSKKEGKTYELPTETEWEYACRAGTNTRFWCGDTDASLKGNANVADASLNLMWNEARWGVPWDDGYAFTSPVGKFKPNPWGLYDMHGNVWQWCADRYGPYPNALVKDPKGPDNGDCRTLRGGSWDAAPRYCRSSGRNFGAPVYRNDCFGLRVVLRPENPSAKSDTVHADIPPSLPPVRELTNTIGMKLVLIPAGKFTMGSPKDEEGRADVEGPQHDVEISKPFYMGAYPVTVGEFRRFVNATGYKTDPEKDGMGGFGFNTATAKGERKPEYTWQHPGFIQEDDHPVVVVSWYDAVAFCTWLSIKEGKTYELPTEAEWEYACRAGTKTRFWCGDADASVRGNANIADASLRDKSPAATWAVSWDDGHPFTSPVGTFKVNPWGLYDMGGNVFQWCADLYGPYQEGSIQDPKGKESGNTRVSRGSTWVDGPRNCRSAQRHAGDPANHFSGDGFRVVLRLPTTTP